MPLLPAENATSLRVFVRDAPTSEDCSVGGCYFDVVCVVHADFFVVKNVNLVFFCELVCMALYGVDFF